MLVAVSGRDSCEELWEVGSERFHEMVPIILAQHDPGCAHQRELQDLLVVDLRRDSVSDTSIRCSEIPSVIGGVVQSNTRTVPAVSVACVADERAVEGDGRRSEFRVLDVWVHLQLIAVHGCGHCTVVAVVAHVHRVVGEFVDGSFYPLCCGRAREVRPQAEEDWPLLDSFPALVLYKEPRSRWCSSPSALRLSPNPPTARVSSITGVSD